MLIFINETEYTDYVRQPSIQIDDRLSDPVPTLQFDLEDPSAAFSFAPWQSVVVLEDTQPANPTHNLYVDPLYSTQTNVSNAIGTITYNSTAGSATFAVSNPTSIAGILSQTYTVPVSASQVITFSIYKNITSVTNCTIFVTTAIINADGSTASSSTDTWTSSGGGTIRYSKTVTIPASGAFLTVTYGVENIPIASSVDAFSRPNQSGWGTADDGEIWANYGDTAHAALSVTGHTGNITGSSSDNYMILGTISDTDNELLVTLNSSTTTSTAQYGVVARYSSPNTGYRCYLKNGTQLVVDKIVSGTVTSLATASFTWSTLTNYTIRFNLTGSTLKGRVWDSSGAEPGTWNITTTDSALASGNSGIYSRAPTTGDATTFTNYSATRTVVASVVFSHPQIEVHRSLVPSYPTPDCVPGAANCTQLPDLSVVREIRLWAGYALTLTRTYFGTERLWSFQCSGIAILLSKRVIWSLTYGAQDDSVLILQQLLPYVSGSIAGSSASVFALGELINGTLVNTYLKDALDAVTQQTGGVYWVDAYGTFHYCLPGNVEADLSLSDTPDLVTSFPYYAYTSTQDATQMVNRLTTASSGTTTVNTYSQVSATGNGSSTTYSWTGLTGVDGVLDVIFDGAVLYQPGQYTIGFTSTTIVLAFTAWTPAAGSSIIVEYYTSTTSTTTSTVLVTDGQSVARYRLRLDGIIQQTTVQSSDAAVAICQADLEVYSTAQTVITLSTQTAFQVGQRVRLTNSADDYASKPFLIQQIQTTILGTSEFGSQVREYQVTMGDYQADFIHQLLYLQRKLTDQTSTTTPSSITSYESVAEEVITCADSVTILLSSAVKGKDTFADRSVSGSFGTASDGQSWTTSSTSGSPTLSVVGSGEGEIDATGNASAQLRLGSHTVTNSESRCRLQLTLTAGDVGQWGMCLRATGTTQMYCVLISSTGGGSSHLLLNKIVSGVTTTVASVALPTFTADGTFWWLRAVVNGSSFTLYAWKDSTMIPSVPTLSTTDTSISSAGQFGLFFTQTATGSNTVQVDSFVALGI